MGSPPSRGCMTTRSLMNASRCRRSRVACDVQSASCMAVVKTDRDLEAWQVGMDLVGAVYSATRTFPRDELFGITAQTGRAAVSIPSNVAERACRRTTSAFNHVSIALGSHAEV